MIWSVVLSVQLLYEFMTFPIAIDAVATHNYYIPLILKVVNSYNSCYTVLQ